MMATVPTAAGKPSFSFGFSKKADPKRVVQALATEKKKDDRVSIIGLEAGQVTVDGPVEEAKLPIIPCKNLLEARHPKPTESKIAATNADAAIKTSAKTFAGDDLPGGLVQRNISQLSSEDAEAARELLRDAASAADGAGSVGVIASRSNVVPILMREGSKKARNGEAPEGSKDMFDRVAVEGFGEALLRGMGFNPDDHKTTPIFHDKPRDGLLGLGAKALLPHEKVAAAKRKASGNSGGTAVASDNAAAVREAEPQDGKRRRAEVWASRGLIVRVVGKDGHLHDFYGVDAVVRKVDDAAGTCTLGARPARDPDGQTQQLPGVRMSEIETRVRRDCENLRVVSGQHRGAVAKVLKRDAKRGTVLVKIEGTELELEFGDVCEFMPAKTA
jgi:hypothetical protein